MLCNLLRRATSAAEWSFAPPNTTRLIPFALRATQPCFKFPGPNPSTLELMLCLSAQTVRLTSTCWSLALVVLACYRLERQLNCISHDCAPTPSFRTCNNNLLLTALPRTGVAFGITESTLTQACLDGPLLALLCRLCSFGRVTTLILVGPSPQCRQRGVLNFRLRPQRLCS